MEVCMSLGIEKVKAIVGLTCDLGNIAGVVLEDGKLGLDDVSVVPALLKILPELSIEPGQAWKELQDYSPEEHAELVEFIKAKLELPQEKVEASIEKVLELSKGLYVSVVGIIDLVKAIKAA
jgi:hypothetical protein